MTSIKMKRRTKIILGLSFLLLAGAAAATRITAGSKSNQGPPAGVEVAYGSLTQKALAVGAIEPRIEISVKSQLSGVVQRQFADVGDFVHAGTPLLEIRPTPTPQELMDAKRQIQLREIELGRLTKEHGRQKELHGRGLIADQEFEQVQRNFAEAALQVQIAHERLELLEQGRVASDEGIKTVVTAPITGYILNKNVEIGDPVVPLSSYQEGTVLMTMANMDDLIFRGSVDEIDVGRLHEGMPVQVKVGALQHARVDGVLSKIWLKAKKEDNSIVFPVEIALSRVEPGDSEVQVDIPVLRAGYSASAEIIIDRRDHVLTIPERMVIFGDDSTFVMVQVPPAGSERRLIRTGLSDAIQVEVVSGLEEGERVLEKPAKELK